jgi:type II secretory pathway predicted ATPase ExeA
MNFDMDSKDYAIMILSGQPELNNTLSMQVHESLAQRIVVNYNFQGLNEDETAEYVRSRMSLCGVTTDAFAPAALIAASASSMGSVRKLNSIIHKSLMIGCEEKLKMIDAETIRKAVYEVELV